MKTDIYIPTAIIGEYKVGASSYIVFILPSVNITRPHLHICDTETFPICSRFHSMIELQSSNYIIKDDTNHLLRDNQLKGLIQFLSSIDEDGDSVWRYAIKTWNMNNQNQKIPIDTAMPDYGNLMRYK